MKARLIYCLLSILLITPTAHGQFCSYKVNALAFAGGNLNSGIEFSVSDKHTLDLVLYYNPVELHNFGIKQYSLKSGFRKWLYEPYVGHFYSINSAFSDYKFKDKTYRKEGWLIGAGVSYGYSKLLSDRWSLVFEGGLMLGYFTRTKTPIRYPENEDTITYRSKNLFVLPDRLAISFSYLF